jgi:hypothetical protein
MTKEGEKGLKKEDIRRKEDLVKVLRIRLEYVQDAIEKYNDAVREANEFIDEMSNIFEAYYHDRSDKWQSEEHGEYYCQFKEEWQKPLEEIEIEGIEDDIDGFSNKSDEPEKS